MAGLPEVLLLRTLFRRVGPHSKTDKKRRDGTNMLPHATYVHEVVGNNETFG